MSRAVRLSAEERQTRYSRTQLGRPLTSAQRRRITHKANRPATRPVKVRRPRRRTLGAFWHDWAAALLPQTVRTPKERTGAFYRWLRDRGLS